MMNRLHVKYLRIRRFFKRIGALFSDPPAPAEIEAEVPNDMRVSAGALGAFGASVPLQRPYTLPKVAPGVLPKGHVMAMDAQINDIYSYANNIAYSEGLTFLGYPYLAELTQRPEYRRPCEIIGKEMTRQWVKLQASGDGDKTERIKELEAELKRLNVQALFQKAAEYDGYFGRSQIFIDVGQDSGDELRMPLIESAAKIAKRGIRRLQFVEPMWTYPAMYNSTNPLAEDYFKPISWYVNSLEVHTSRLLTFISRPVPDLLKPTYSFGGLALQQMLKPYVDNWIRTRTSVSDLIHSFSVMGLKTNMATVLQGGAAISLANRATLFNQGRDNRGLMLVDKETEEFFNVAVPLTTLDKLQAQAQEHMSSVCGIPLLVMFGITPTGLNASNEEELEAWFNWIHAQQEALFTSNLSRLINLIEISLWGEVDPEIGFIYNKLQALDEVELATTEKTQMETDTGYINAGVLSPEEVRTRLASEEDAPYAGLDVADVPAPIDDGSDPNLDDDPEQK